MTSGNLNAEAILNFWIMYIFSDTKFFVLRPWFPSFPLKLTGSTKEFFFSALTSGEVLQSVKPLFSKAHAGTQDLCCWF